MTVKIINTILCKGDPLAPQSSDILLQEGQLDVGLPVPTGWQMLSGNHHYSFVARIAYRGDIAPETVPE